MKITLEGVTYEMRPSHDAIDDFEIATDSSLQDLARDAATGAMKTRTAAIIVTRCMQEWGRSGGATPSKEQRTALGVNVDRVRALLVEEGMLLIVARLKLMLWLAVSGGLTSAGEAKAMPTTTEASPTPEAGSAA